ncbi:similar to Saccharomyces cerevisiae YMR027W Putative protein of unknown function [Maudiozyma barnettii]|uniref:Sugar phosphate phosphatase n=1 Tax=Maudiozyma barnettii TaxID=61262 RepID=A0A8H2ZMA9_9SACH|nr:putative methyltransferase [Kazachstania barnettii]CAB4256912.1 similar to Saccharomyces cerevisiae YMR027W Putative protein of unknown function [Kazachstania barnettii]CAD1785517.1 similar to Saccharomyces cerevisiae YMR027W Putative protein of unknown function [Kazachstania barnettii]
MSISIAPRFLTSDKGTFGEYTASTRWPIIIQNSVDDVAAEIERISKSSNDDKYAIVQQGETIKKQLIEFRQEIIKNVPLRKFTTEECEIASVPLSFNEYLDTVEEKPTWNNSEWLFCEIYLYRRMNVLFRSQAHQHWKNFDIFNDLKQSTFEASYYGVTELALRYKNLLNDISKLNKKDAKDQELLQILFKEFIEISLWGNATDLSLLTNATLEDIKSIQGAKAREESESKIVVNDTNNAWDILLKAATTKENIRVDFVLDNSGFELYADLMLAAFLLQTKLATKCVFHAKDMPYMVSDVMLKDFDILVADLRDRKFFPAGKDTEESNALELFADDISNFHDKGMLTFEADSFWTTDLDYWNIDPSETKYHGNKIHEELKQSDLVIFKGDLNYRKLTGDRKWPRTTAWETAIGPLSTNGISVLSLRTCKADVQVALKSGVDEELSKLWEKDHPGQGSWWCCSGKWAVICFSASK